MRLSRQHAKKGSFHWHLWEVHSHVSRHFTWKNIFHTHGTILGIAGLKLLAAEAFVLKVLAGPALFLKGAIIAGMSAIPFFTNAGFVSIADQNQPQVIKAQWASEKQGSQNQGSQQPARAGAITVSKEDSFKADLKNIKDGFVDTPLYDPTAKTTKSTLRAAQKTSKGVQQAGLQQLPSNDGSVGTTTLEGITE